MCETAGALWVITVGLSCPQLTHTDSLWVQEDTLAGALLFIIK